MGVSRKGGGRKGGEQKKIFSSIKTAKKEMNPSYTYSMLE